MDAINNILYSITANIIYDIAKSINDKVFIKREQKDYFDNEIKKIKVPEEFLLLAETGILEKIKNTPQIVDMIQTYTLYQVGISTNTSLNFKESSPSSENDFLNELSNKIYKLYVQNESLSSISQLQINKYLKYITNNVKAIIFNGLDQSNKSELILISSRMNFLYNNIKQELNDFRKFLTQNNTFKFVAQNNNFLQIKDEYHNILKSKNSEAHIYLLDKFQFDRFYVPPILKNTNIVNLSFGKKIISKDLIYFKEPETEYIETIKDDIVKYNRFEYNIMLNNIYTDDYSKDHSNDWKHIFDNNNIVYITGGAGYGKSLFLQKLINDFSDLNIFKSDEYLIIRGELKSFYPNNADSPISVERFLQNSMKSSTLMDESKISLELIRHYLQMGRCIILFDALDEVEKTKRDELHETLISFLKNQNPNNKICITSRDRGFIPENDVEVLAIQPLNDKQIEKYVDNIISLGKFEKNDKDTFMKQTKKLIDKGFLNSFLVLSLLVNIYKSEKELPENKLELYQKCFEYISNKREKDKTVNRYNWGKIAPLMKDNTFMELADMCFPNNTPVDKKVILEKLLKIYKSKYDNEVSTENAIEEFIKFCSDRTELFVPASEENKFKFFHRSFFEYFYSQYIFVRFNDENDILEKLMLFDVDSEVFELTVAMLKQKSEEKYQKIIELMFVKAKEELNDKYSNFNVFNILILSMQVVDDVIYRNDFIDLLIKYKEKIVKSMNKIHNSDIIFELIKRDKLYCKKICNSYYNEAMISVFSILLNINFNNNNIWRDKNISFKQIFQHALHLSEKSFYTNLFIENVDITGELNKLDNNKIDNICRNAVTIKKVSNKKIKQYQSVIKIYNSKCIGDFNTDD